MSFSSAGWFWRLGRRQLRRPVSVLMLSDAWIRLFSSTCKNQILNQLKITQTFHR